MLSVRYPATVALMLVALSACQSRPNPNAAPYTEVRTQSIPPLSAAEMPAPTEDANDSQGYYAALDHRSLETIRMDQSIVQDIQKKLEHEPAVEPSKIMIHSYNGVVRLLGTAVDQDAVQKIIEISSHTPNVNKVIAEHLRITHVGMTLAARSL